MSHYTKARPAGYYNDLLIENDNDFHKLLRKYSLSPKANINSYFGKLLGTIKVNDGATDPDFAASTRSEDIKLRKIEANGKLHMSI